MDERVRFFELGRDADNAALPAAVAERPIAKSVTQLHSVVEGKGPPVTANRPAVQAAAGHGSPRRTQRAVAAAVNGHADWKDF
jgi:hypothetical protein